MNWAWDAEATTDFLDAISYYEAESLGLGKRFSDAIEETIRSIAEYPLARPLQKKNVRKCIVERFPYCILYRVLDDHFRILAVTHMRRSPDSWSKRLDDTSR